MSGWREGRAGIFWLRSLSGCSAKSVGSRTWPRAQRSESENITCNSLSASVARPAIIVSNASTSRRAASVSRRQPSRSSSNGSASVGKLASSSLPATPSTTSIRASRQRSATLIRPPHGCRIAASHFGCEAERSRRDATVHPLRLGGSQRSLIKCQDDMSGRWLSTRLPTRIAPRSRPPPADVLRSSNSFGRSRRAPAKPADDLRLLLGPKQDVFVVER